MAPHHTHAWSLALLLALPTACDDDEPGVAERCAALDEASCESVTFEAGGCHWIEVHSAPSGASECSDLTTQGRCMAVQGSQQGCGGVDCNGGDGENVWYRATEDVDEVAVNPLCGPDIVGEGWVSCGEGALPSPLCACSCD